MPDRCNSRSPCRSTPTRQASTSRPSAWLQAKGRAALDQAKTALREEKDGPAKLCAESFIARGLGVFALQVPYSACWPQAQVHLQRSLKHHPFNASSMYLLGMIKMEDWEPDLEQAVLLMARSIVLDPDFRGPYVNLGAAFLRLGSSEAAMCQPFVRAASWLPHTRGSWEVLREAGLRMGRVLAAKGLVGFASLDVVFFENPGFDASRLAQEREATPAVIGSDTPLEPEHLMFRELRSPSPAMSAGSAEGRCAASLPESRQADYELAQQLQDMQPGHHNLNPVALMLAAPPEAASPLSRFACWVVDVDARLTDEAAALFPLQFVAQVRPEVSSGAFRLTAEAPQQEDNQGTSEESNQRPQRWALVSHVARCPGLDRMSYQSLFQAAKMRGVSFDLFHNVGCVFTFLDVFGSLFSLLAVEKTPEHCARRLAAALAALAEGQGPRGQQAARAKAAAPRDAPLPPCRETEATDGLAVADVQAALRQALKRWAERPRPLGDSMAP
mmetsp:Transcript_55733/g.172941  ORF Transcript_55733/g.172941 Transcript_55733/m.172941 type:complete len:501 (+) Transcript_55733:232-1734(+)